MMPWLSIRSLWCWLWGGHYWADTICVNCGLIRKTVPEDTP